MIDLNLLTDYVKRDDFNDQMTDFERDITDAIVAECEATAEEKVTSLCAEVAENMTKMQSELKQYFTEALSTLSSSFEHLTQTNMQEIASRLVHLQDIYFPD